MLAVTAAATIAAFQAPATAGAALERTSSISMAARKKPVKKPAPKPRAAPRPSKGGLPDFMAQFKGADYIDVSGDAYVAVSAPTSTQYDEIGVLPPIGRWDPLKIREQGPARYRRFVEMEIKHGRMAMAATAGVLATYSGLRFPGYLSKSLDLKFEDIPGSMIGSWATVPTTAWLQIIGFIAVCEVDWLQQDPNKPAGDIVKENFPWARYPDGYPVWLGDGSVKNVAEDELFLGKTWKLNAERNNGRAAMMGITGMFIHELLTGNPVFPIGETSL